jgi:hypothetical protein
MIAVIVATVLVVFVAAFLAVAFAFLASIYAVYDHELTDDEENE